MPVLFASIQQDTYVVKQLIPGLYNIIQPLTYRRHLILYIRRVRFKACHILFSYDLPRTTQKVPRIGLLARNFGIVGKYLRKKNTPEGV